MAEIDFCKEEKSLIDMNLFEPVISLSVVVESGAAPEGIAL